MAKTRLLLLMPAFLTVCPHPTVGKPPQTISPFLRDQRPLQAAVGRAAQPLAPGPPAPGTRLPWEEGWACPEADPVSRAGHEAAAVSMEHWHHSRA